LIAYYSRKVHSALLYPWRKRPGCKWTRYPETLSWCKSTVRISYSGWKC